MEEGATFDSLVARAIALDSATASLRATAALQRFGIDEFIAEARTRSAETGAQVVSIEDFYTLGRFRLVFDVAVPMVDGQALFDTNFTASQGGAVQPIDGVMLFTDPRVLTTELQHASLVVRNHPVLMDMRGAPTEPPRARFTILLPELPRIQRYGRVNGWKLDIPGMQFNATSGVIIEAGGDSLLVRVELPGTGAPVR
jgi:hypothetical protein